MENNFKSIQTPIKIKNVELANRIGLGPINTGFFNNEGEIFNKKSFYKHYINEKLGCIYIGGIAVSKNGKSNCVSLLLDSEEKASGIKKIVNFAHSKDVKIILQIMHAGRQTNPKEIGDSIVSPSPLPCEVIGVIPKELNYIEINKIKEDFIRSSIIACNNGADLIEIHAAHGYLISEFLSKTSNHRDDKYGGTLKNRFRLLYEILEGIRDSNIKCPIGIRINCKDNFHDRSGYTEKIIGIKNYLHDLVDFVSISAGFYSKYNDIIIPSRNLGRGLWKDYAYSFKQELKKPIFLTGNIDSLELAEHLISNNYADFILMVRSLIAEPFLLSKKFNKVEGQITECINCNSCKYHSNGLRQLFCPKNFLINDKNFF